MKSKHHNYQPIGDLIAGEQWAKAQAKIVALLVAAGGEHGAQTGAAEALGVTGRTMRRWIAELTAAGFDPRPEVTETIAAKAAKKAAKKPTPRKRAA